MIDRHRPAPRAPFSLALAAALALAVATPPATSAAPVPSRDRRFTFDDSLPSLAPPAERGQLVLVREVMARKNPLPPEPLYLDGAPLGYLPQVSWTLAEVPPGVHRLEGVLDCPPLVLEIRAGETVLLRLREVIDPDDRIITRWLLDAPDAAEGLIERGALLRASPTPRGLADLAKRARTELRAQPADTLMAPADTGVVVVFDNIWFEHPLDPLNFRREFSIYSGQLEIGASGLSYYMQKNRRDVRVDIPFADVENLRFGGTRSAVANPWIDLFYASEGQSFRASFADAGPESERAYNRMFAILRERWRAHRRPAGEPPGLDRSPR